MSDVFPLSEISGLSFDFPFLSPLFFCLVLLLFLSDHFSADGPFSVLTGFFHLKIVSLTKVTRSGRERGKYTWHYNVTTRMMCS